MGEWQIFQMLKDHFGAVGAVAGIVILLAIRFLPSWLTDLRSRRLEARDEQLRAKQEYTQREHDLLAKIDKKDAILEKLTGNHIQHLEMQLVASREFYSEATKALREMNQNIVEARREHVEMSDDLGEVKDVCNQIKGAVQ